jgi:hypothetical protein
VLLVLILTAIPSLADTAAAWAALRAGNAVALIRHADAPGIGDLSAALAQCSAL